MHYKLSYRVASCNLLPISLTEEYILDIEAFLQVYPLTAFEAQIIIEVSNYPNHHVDINTVAKKIPQDFFKDGSNNIEDSVKSLIERGYLEPYGGKKDVLCVRCSKLGRDVARQIRLSCFSGALKLFDREKKSIDARKRRLCVNPLGFKVGEKRFADGPKGKIKIVIRGLFCSDNVYATFEDRVEYERRVVTEVECPQCHDLIRIEYCFNPSTLYQKYLEIGCVKCNYHFFLAYYLMKYYDLSNV